ncbi:MAG: hypothetical protein C4321_03930 [Chloroflexota bacterium]
MAHSYPAIVGQLGPPVALFLPFTPLGSVQKIHKTKRESRVCDKLCRSPDLRFSYSRPHEGGVPFHDRTNPALDSPDPDSRYPRAPAQRREHARARSRDRVLPAHHQTRPPRPRVGAQPATDSGEPPLAHRGRLQAAIRPLSTYAAGEPRHLLRDAPDAPVRRRAGLGRAYRPGEGRGSPPEEHGRAHAAYRSRVRQLPVDREAAETLARLTEAWATNRTVIIDYRSAHAARLRRYQVDPYILDHTESGTYLVGFSYSHGEVRVFKVDRIRAVEQTGREFAPVNLDRLAEVLRNSWGGVVLRESRYDIVIDFTPAVASRIRESYWHVSQELESLPGGGVRLKVSLPSLLEITPWVMSWCPEAIVVAPDELRQRVADLLRATAARYA